MNNKRGKGVPLTVNPDNKRGQVTIFIIIAIIIVAGIAIIILLRSKSGENKPTYTASEDPSRFIRECVGEALETRINSLIENGGIDEPELFINFNGSRIAYLCYSTDYYNPCINQHTMIINEVEKEIKEKIGGDVDECFTMLSIDYQRKDISVNLGSLQNMEFDLNDRKAVLGFEKELIFSQNGELKKFNDLNIVISSPAYNILRAAVEIIAQESDHCDSDYINYQILYPSFRIYRIEALNQTKIYRIIDKSSGVQMNFAVRGCSSPEI